MDAEIFKTTNKFQNPLRQNFKHIKALESLTGLPLETFHSVIVFLGGSEFKTEMPPHVTYAGSYVAYIKSKTQIMLSAADVEAVHSAISTGRLAPSFATNREHVENVKRRLDPDAPKPCPKCGAAMVLRNKAGNNFWGCSAFPKCRTIQNIA